MYLVMAYRMGVRNNYNYPVGVFCTESDAIQAAKMHHDFRGGKYNHIIWFLELGVEYDAEEAKQVWSSL